MIFNPITTGLMEGATFVGRLAARKGMYVRAVDRANETGRPLVVVGAPSAGWVTGSLAQYQCGDLPCVDLRGCETCGAAPADVTVEGAIPAKDDSAVVLVAYVLEYVEDEKAAEAEIMRAAGHPSNVFVACAGMSGITQLATNARRVVVAAPPNAPDFRYRSVMRPRKTVAVTRKPVLTW